MLGLDLFCGGGGCTRGYLEGFDACDVPLEMVGVDKWPQPRYAGDHFVRADVMKLLINEHFIRQFDFVHMSPPCQIFSPTRTFKNSKKHIDLLTPALQIVKERYSDMIWVTENVVEAHPLFSRKHQILRLCGSSFPNHSAYDERRLLHRHRNFRLHNFTVPKLLCAHNGYKPKGVYGSLNSQHPGGGEIAESFGEACKLMQIDWMKWDELKEAIPPAYTKYVATEGMVRAVLERRAFSTDYAGA